MHVVWSSPFPQIALPLLLEHSRVQKKTTSMSLTIRSSSPKTPEALPHRSTLVQALSQPSPRVRHQPKHSTRKCLCSSRTPPEWNVPVLQMQSPVSSLYAGEVSGPPIFTKVSLSTGELAFCSSLPLENHILH